MTPGYITLLALAATLFPAAAAVAETALPDPFHDLFVTSDHCLACHNDLEEAAGTDISIGADWRASMMANASRDPYWQAAVRREVLEHPAAAEAIQDECSACHMPMARYAARAAGGHGRVFANLPPGGHPGAEAALAADGVSCAMCHQIQAEGLGTPESFTAGFAVDTSTAPGERPAYGPFEVDAGRQRVMSSASTLVPGEGKHVQRSELCATCHTLYTHSRAPGGEVIDELPEQVPYLEWRHSAYKDSQSCQSCHMPVVEQEAAVSSVLGKPRQKVSRHVFRGGNFFMLRMLDRHRDELGVVATSAELRQAARRTVDHLQESTARLALENNTVADGVLETVVRVKNLAGHKLPTAYPSRRAWLHVEVTDGAGHTVFESGALGADGAIAGNDNDRDPRRYEPHHRVIDSPDQVQIYEAIMADSEGTVTTGLIRAVRFIKDNRLLPKGFDKTTAVEDIAVQGDARVDPAFTAGGDRVTYRVNVKGSEGPYRVRAALWYQPIAHRWAMNLAPFDAPETNRFVRYYGAMADESGVAVARAEAMAAASR